MRGTRECRQGIFERSHTKHRLSLRQTVIIFFSRYIINLGGFSHVLLIVEIGQSVRNRFSPFGRVKMNGHEYLSDYLSDVAARTATTKKRLFLAFIIYRSLGRTILPFRTLHQWSTTLTPYRQVGMYLHV